MTTSFSIDSKLPNVGTSIFSEMSALANKLSALNLSQGFPEFETPAFLKESVHQAILANKNQYAPSQGLPDLLTEIAKLTKRQYGVIISESEMVTITSGATEALFVAFQALINPDDEVIIFDPAFDSYKPVIELIGGRCVHIPLQSPEYAVNWRQVESKINSKTKLIVINSPHNPTGTLLTDDDMKCLQKLVVDNQLFLISDEVYEYMTFDGLKHHSALLYPELFARSFVISSFGKTYHCTGWKMGYCIAPKNLTEEFRKIHQFVTFCSSTPFQVGITKMLAESPQHVEQLSSFYQEKRDVLVKALTGSRFKVLPSSGTYFLLVDYSEISDLNDYDFCNWMAKEIGVVAVPLSPFYETPTQDKIIRICFAKFDETLVEAGERMGRL